MLLLREQRLLSRRRITGCFRGFLVIQNDVVKVAFFEVFCFCSSSTSPMSGMHCSLHEKKN